MAPGNPAVFKRLIQWKGFGGAKGSRTPDLLHAMQALSQLSYGPIRVGADFSAPG